MAKKKMATISRKKSKKTKTSKKDVGLLGKALRALGGAGGGVVGGMFGAPLAGAAAGTGLGATISRWLGAGDYTVAANSIVRSTLRSSENIPMMHTSGQTVTIRHKEFIAEISGSVGFTVQRFFLIQPGDSNTFPWLSDIANKYQQYKIKGLVFHYVPTSGYAVSGTNPAIGSVMLQTSYRANDTAPTSKVEMLNEYWASESSPADSFCHPLECSPSENPFSIHYTRNQPVPANDSPLMYDLGQTWVATSGMPGANVVGDLFVTYEIELSKPIVTSGVTDSILSSSRLDGTASPGNWFGGTTETSQFGTGVILYNTSKMTFPVGTTGTYLIVVSMISSAYLTAMNLAGAPTFTNCTGVNLPNGSQYSATNCTSAVNLTGGDYILKVNLVQSGLVASVQFPAGTWTGTVNAVIIEVAAC